MKNGKEKKTATLILPIRATDISLPMVYYIHHAGIARLFAILFPLAKYLLL